MKIKKKIPKLMSALLAVVMMISALPMSAFAAAASDLPANMTDHSILRALEYTGYDVQQQIKDGTHTAKPNGRLLSMQTMTVLLLSMQSMK